MINQQQELNDDLIGATVYCIEEYPDGTFEFDTHEQRLIGYRANGIVTWDIAEKYYKYVKNGRWFIDKEQTLAKLKELRGR